MTPGIGVRTVIVIEHYGYSSDMSSQVEVMRHQGRDVLEVRLKKGKDEDERPPDQADGVARVVEDGRVVWERRHPEEPFVTVGDEVKAALEGTSEDLQDELKNTVAGVGRCARRIEEAANAIMLAAAPLPSEGEPEDEAEPEDESKPEDTGTSEV